MRITLDVPEELIKKVLAPLNKDEHEGLLEGVLLEHIRASVQAQANARDPEVFAAKCLERVATFEVGRRFGVIEAVPPHTGIDTENMKALGAALRNSPLVRSLEEHERVEAPYGTKGRILQVCERI